MNSTWQRMEALRNLMTEIYKTTNLIRPSYVWNLFVEEDVPYNLRAKVLHRLPTAQSNRHGLNSISFRAGLLWNTLDDEIELVP